MDAGSAPLSVLEQRKSASFTAAVWLIGDYTPAEIEAAVAEGVELLTLVAPAGIEVDENGHVSGVRVTPRMISTIKRRTFPV